MGDRGPASLARTRPTSTEGIGTTRTGPGWRDRWVGPRHQIRAADMAPVDALVHGAEVVLIEDVPGAARYEPCRLSPEGQPTSGECGTAATTGAKT